MPTYKLTIAYDGTDFVGWQKQEPKRDQPGLPPEDGRAMQIAKEAALDPASEDRVALRSVQAVVERAVSEAAREPVSVLGASRTDSGVHAKAQVAIVRSRRAPDDLDDRGINWPTDRGTEPLRKAINARLPDDVVITAVEHVDDRFDPIGHCVAKGYSYTIHASFERPLWNRRVVHHTWFLLDADRMAEAAAHVVGEHDFASFAALGHGRKTTVRTVHTCDVNKLNEHTIRIDISGNGFLWNMVRIIAGTLVEVGRGKVAPADLPMIIAAQDRTAAGPTLPPTGLCLEWIRYPDDPHRYKSQ